MSVAIRFGPQTQIALFEQDGDEPDYLKSHEFRVVYEGHSIGFYNWLRSAEHGVVGLSLLIREDPPDCSEILLATGLVHEGISELYIPFVADWDFDPSISNDCGLARCQLFLTPRGDVCVVVDSGWLSERDWDSLRKLRDSPSPGSSLQPSRKLQWD